MITKLEERGRLKANRYWPSKKKQPLQFDNGVSVKIVDKEKIQDDLIKRSFEVSHQGRFPTQYKFIKPDNSLVRLQIIEGHGEKANTPKKKA